MPLPFAGNANQVQYATSVAAYLAQVYAWDPSFALANDPEVYEKQLRDIAISGALDHLQRSIVGQDFTFEPEEDDRANRALAKILTRLTKKQRFFPQSLYNLARATHRGAAWGRIYPKKLKLKLGDGKERWWTVIDKVRDVDKRRFRLTQTWAAAQAPGSPLSQILRQEDGPARSAALARAVDEAPGFNQPLSSAGYDAGALGNFRWEFHRGFDGKHSSSMWWGPVEAAAPLDHWILHIPDTSEQGMGYGYGLADELQSYFWLKGSFLRWFAQGCERWGQGFLIAKTKAMRELMAKGYSQQAALAVTVSNMRTWRSENVAAVDEATEIQLLDMPGEGARWLFEGIKYLDNGMRQRILAALQTTGSGDGDGGFSSAKVEETSEDTNVHFLRSPLEETWTHTAVRYLVDHNEEPLRELGLWDLAPSHLRLHGKQKRNMEQMIKVFELAMKLRIPVKKVNFYETFELEAPNEEEDEAIEYPEALPGLDQVQPGGRIQVGGGDTGDGEREPIGDGGESVAEVGAVNGAAA